MSRRPTATKCYSTQTCAYAAWEYAVHCLCVYFFAVCSRAQFPTEIISHVCDADAVASRKWPHFCRKDCSRALPPFFAWPRVSRPVVASAQFPPSARVCAMPILARLSAYNGVSRRSRFTYTFLCPPAKRPTATTKKHHRIGWVVTVAGSCAPCMAVSIYWREPLAKSTSARI